MTLFFVTFFLSIVFIAYIIYTERGLSNEEKILEREEFFWVAIEKLLNLDQSLVLHDSQYIICRTNYQILFQILIFPLFFLSFKINDRFRIVKDKTFIHYRVKDDQKDCFFQRGPSWNQGHECATGKMSVSPG